MKKKKSPKKRILTPRTRNANTWTEAEYFSRIRNALRRVFRYYKVGQIALEKAKRLYEGKGNKLQKWEYQCYKCKKWKKRADVQIDHTIPCGELRAYSDIVPFIQRLTEENPDLYQILCKACHLKKTKKESSDRRKLRKNNE